MTAIGEDFVQRLRVSRGAWVPELKGKVAIITGAGRLRSIGRAISLEFARQGVKVVITGTGRNPDTAPPDEKAVGWRDIESVAEEVRTAGSEALTMVADVSDPAAAEDTVERALKTFGRLDILVNNASAARGPDRVSITEMPYDVWTRVINVNLHGTFLLCKAVGRELIRRGEGGSIVNISSIASKIAAANFGPYAASKAAINALSRTLALEMAPHGIRVNAICPGVVDTSRMDDLGRSERWEEAIKAIPLGRAGTGLEIAYFCTYLCSDMGSWITGQAINVDGGHVWH